MNFNLSAEQEMVRNLRRNLSKNEIMPIAEELDKTGQFPYEVWKRWVIWEFVESPIWSRIFHQWRSPHSHWVLLGSLCFEIGLY